MSTNIFLNFDPEIHSAVRGEDYYNRTSGNPLTHPRIGDKVKSRETHGGVIANEEYTVTDVAYKGSHLYLFVEGDRTKGNPLNPFRFTLVERPENIPEMEVANISRAAALYNAGEYNKRVQAADKVVRKFQDDMIDHIVFMDRDGNNLGKFVPLSEAEKKHLLDALASYRERHDHNVQENLVLAAEAEEV